MASVTDHSSGKPRPRWRDGLVNPRPVPADFERRFVEIGRVGLEEHYGVGRLVIDHWLEHCGMGKPALIRARAEHVAKHSGRIGRDGVNRYGRETVDRWLAQRKRKDMGKLLSIAFPVDNRPVDSELAVQAAQFLRMACNGGWPVSLGADGLWIVGTSRRSAFEMVEFARRKGFDGASLSGRGE